LSWTTFSRIAKIYNKPLYVFDQQHSFWFFWNQDTWTETEMEKPLVTATRFAATGTPYLEDNNRLAVQDFLSVRSPNDDCRPY
jgi:hypothetical protein